MRTSACPVLPVSDARTLVIPTVRAAKPAPIPIPTTSPRCSARTALKFGGQFRDVYSNNNDNFSSRAAFSFSLYSDFGASAAVLQNLSPGVDNLNIENESSGLLGLVAVQNQTQYFDLAGNRHATDELNFAQHETAVYIQDEWKVKSNLSVTYGVRWEYYGVPYERNGDLANLFVDPSGQAPFTFTPVGPGTGHQLYKSTYNNFEPRVGFAWDPFKTGKTSVRGGNRTFSDRVYGNLIGDVRGNPPFQPSVYNYPFFRAPARTPERRFRISSRQLSNPPLPSLTTKPEPFPIFSRPH